MKSSFSDSVKDTHCELLIKITVKDENIKKKILFNTKKLFIAGPSKTLTILTMRLQEHNGLRQY